MLALIQYDAIPLAVSFVVGIGTGWWMFRDYRNNAGRRS